MELPQYLQILSHGEPSTVDDNSTANRWAQLIYLANSGWLGTNPRCVFTNKYNSDYIDKLLALPLGIPTDVYQMHHVNYGDTNLGWASNADLKTDNDGATRYYYGGDEPSNDASEESDDTWQRGRNEENEEADEDEDEFDEDSDETPVFITRGTPFYSLLGRRFTAQHKLQLEQPRAATRETNEEIPYKLIPHRDVFTGGDDSVVIDGTHIKVDGILLKPECALVSAVLKPNSETYSTPTYSLPESALSTPFPHLTQNQHVKLYESNDLMRKLNLERRLLDQENIYASFVSSTCVPSDVGIYYYEVTVMNTMTNINEGLSIGLSCLSPSKVEEYAWCDDSIKEETLCVMWEAKSGKLRHRSDHKTQSADTWPPYNKGDTIGFGVDFVKRSVFGTKNGVPIGEQKLDDIANVENAQYVTVNLGVHTEVKVNLGASHFRFDILNYVRDQKATAKASIKGESFIPFTLPDGTVVDDDLSIEHFVDELVLGYLRHKGFVDTAIKLEEEMGSTTKSSKWKEAASFKKTIRGLLAQDQIDQVMNLITIKFPDFWTVYERMEFKLLCFKYIKMIQNASTDAHTKDILRFGKLLNRRFSNDEASLNELDQLSQLLAYADPTSCPQWESIMNSGKARVEEALIMAISESFGMSCLTGIDLALLRADVNLQSLKRHQRKDLALVDILNDYIKL